jgi:hypothetical protein
MATSELLWHYLAIMAALGQAGTRAVSGHVSGDVTTVEAAHASPTARKMAASRLGIVACRWCGYVTIYRAHSPRFPATPASPVHRMLRAYYIIIFRIEMDYINGIFGIFDIILTNLQADLQVKVTCWPWARHRHPDPSIAD